MSWKTNVRKLPMCAKLYTVGPQVYMRTSPGRRGTKDSLRPVSVFCNRISPISRQRRGRHRGLPYGESNHKRKRAILADASARGKRPRSSDVGAGTRTAQASRPLGFVEFALEVGDGEKDGRNAENARQHPEHRVVRAPRDPRKQSQASEHEKGRIPGNARSQHRAEMGGIACPGVRRRPGLRGQNGGVAGCATRLGKLYKTRTPCYLRWL